MTRVGFAGLGRMGMPMARNIHWLGYELTVWNRTKIKADEFASALKCNAVATPKELVDQSDVVITMLADDASSQEVHHGENGLFKSKKAITYLEMGTMSPHHILALSRSCPDNARIIDAPVSGSTQAAKAGNLMIMVGSDSKSIANFKAILEAMGSKVIALGKLGAASVVKLAINSMIHGINQNFSEAMSVALAAKIEPQLAFDAIEASAACPPMLCYRRPLYLDEKNNEVTFTISLARKDMNAFMQLASANRQEAPLGEVTTRLLEQAENAGYGGRDMAAMLDYMKGQKSI